MILSRSYRGLRGVRTVRQRASIALALLVLSSCSGVLDWLGGKELKPSYCDQHPNDQQCQQQFPDADTRCKSSADCMAPTAVCDLTGMRMCVQCIAPDQTAACTATTPTCGADHACHPCRAHDDCPLSKACLADGSCAATAQVAYVDPMMGSGNTCSISAPCKKLADALATGRPYAKLRGTTDEPVQINNQNVTILAEPGAQLTRTSPGVILRVDGTSVVDIFDLAIVNGLGPTGIGISLPSGNSASLHLERVTVAGNAGGGIFASGGTVIIARSTISQNTAGGISMSGSQFDIANNFIAGNGGGVSTFGGIAVDAIGANAVPPHRIDFNTITANLGPSGANLGLACGTVLTPLTFSNNIIYMNIVSGAGRQMAGMNCAASYSDIGPDGLPGMGNINMPPMFANPSQNDFHLMSGSPARDAADPQAGLAIDFDGDSRPQGARSDMGADEVKQ